MNLCRTTALPLLLVSGYFIITIQNNTSQSFRARCSYAIQIATVYNNEILYDTIIKASL